MRKPKILIALFRLPYPATDGTRYKILYNLAEGLKRDFDIEFFVVSIKAFRKSDVEFLENNFGKVHVFHHSKLAYGLNSIPAFWNGLPLQAEAFLFRDAQTWLETHKKNYDAFYVHEIRMTEYFIRWSDEEKGKILVDFNDAISLHYRDAAKRMWLPKKIFYQFEGRRVAKYETRVLRSFQHFNIVSERDRAELLSRLPEGAKSTKDVRVIPHGAPLSKSVATGSDRSTLVFVGSLDYEPNRDALTLFLRDTWPAIRTAFPEARLDVIGGGLVLPWWRGIRGVSFRGFVPSVFEAVKDARAFVAPVRFAGGTSSKILEAMGYGLPVITNPEGIAGISGAEDGAHVLVVPQDDSTAWRDAVSVLQNPATWKGISAAARALVAERYSSEASQEAFRKRLGEIAAKQKRT